MNKVFGGILGLGVISSVATAIAAPSSFPETVAAFGGALASASVVNEQVRKKQSKVEESLRVATAFRNLYESNRGLLSPQQLSIAANIPLELASKFLKALCEEQKGNYIPTEKGEVFNFPHTANVLDQLTNNAQAWANSQKDPLLQENATLKAELARLQMLATRQAPPATPQPMSGNVNTTNEGVDPWNNLL